MIATCCFASACTRNRQQRALMDASKGMMAVLQHGRRVESWRELPVEASLRTVAVVERLPEDERDRPEDRRQPMKRARPTGNFMRLGDRRPKCATPQLITASS
jgi:hypothetical protein